MWGGRRCGLVTTRLSFSMVHYQSNGMQGNTTQLTSKRGRICHLSEELIQEENSILQEKRVVMCQLCSELHCSLHSTPPPLIPLLPPPLPPSYLVNVESNRKDGEPHRCFFDGRLHCKFRASEQYFQAHLHVWRCHWYNLMVHANVCSNWYGTDKDN